MQSIMQSIQRLGLPKLSAESLRAASLTENFEGLPETLTRSEVLTAARRAAPLYGLSDPAVMVLSTLMTYSFDQDWTAGSRPIVWPSNHVLTTRLAWSLSKVQRALRELRSKGFIADRSDSNGQRRGHRMPNDRTGQIVEAVGLDLSPLAARYAEFTAVYEAHLMEQSQLRELRREAVRMKRRIDNAVATALACELDGEWAPAADEADTLLCGKPISIAEAAGTVEALRALYGPLAERLEAGLRALDGDEMTPTGAEDDTHILTTTELQFDKSNMYPASQGGRSGSVENPDLTPDSLLPLELVKKACAEIGEYGFKPKSWSELVEAAAQVRGWLGVSEHAWGEACHKMGRNHAAVAVAIILERQQSIGSPGGYLRAMTRRAQRGELFLNKSLFALLTEKGEHWGRPGPRPRPTGDGAGA
jgi:replication initiation protein RepC